MNIFADTDRKITKLKYKALQSVKRKDYELALQLIDCVASIEYLYNQSYVDNELEELLVSIGKAVINTRSAERKLPEPRNVLFYDGFGFDTRGLALIYLRALAVNGYHIVYLTDERNLGNLTEINQLITDYKGDMLGIPNKISNVQRAGFIYQKVQDYSIGKAFFYTTPSDASGAAAFSSFPDNTIRFQINLTDHAFWLGRNVFDYCIEFRNYGASISHFYRGIDSKKLLLQPYYPVISKEMPFQGFPFQKKEDDFVIFSGGALYKTEGRDNGYYQIVRRILSEHKNVKFWYAGFGENKEMNRLLADYRGQAFYTAERKDLYQILCNCDVYLNTYPFPGGLMTQYAAKAGLVPLKVKTGPEADGLLLDQEELGIDFDTIDDLVNEVEKMLEEPAYKKKKSDLLIRAVLSERDFNLNLKDILENGSSHYALELKKIDDKEFIHTYKERYGRFDVETIVGSLRYTGFMRTMPFYYSLSLLKKIVIGWRYFINNLLYNLQSRPKKYKKH